MGAGLVKQCNLQKEFVASELHRKGVVVDIIGLPAERFKLVRFRFSPVEGEEEDDALRTVVTYKRKEMLTVDISLHMFAALCSEGVEVLNLCGRCQLRLTSLLSFLNDHNIHMPADGESYCDVMEEDGDSDLDGFVLVQQVQRYSSKGAGESTECTAATQMGASRASSISGASGCLPTIEEERED